MALFDGAEHEDELGGQHVFAPHRLELRTGRRFMRDARGEGHDDLDAPGVDPQPLRQLLAGIAVDRNETAGGAQRTAVEPQQHQPLGQRIEMRVAQKIEVVDGHHAGYPPQQRQGQPGAEAVVEVELLITRPVNDILSRGHIRPKSSARCRGSKSPAGAAGVSSNPIFITLRKIFRLYGK